MHQHCHAAAGLEPDEFVEDMKKKGIRVPGIGHRIKSKVSTFWSPVISYSGYCHHRLDGPGGPGVGDEVGDRD